MRATNDLCLPDPKTVIHIDYLPEYSIEDYDLSDPKEMRRYFFDIERICRNSYAYKRMIGFLRDHVSMNRCSFYKNLNNIDTYSIKIQIHHSPLTLYDIVYTIYCKRLATGQPLTVNMIAREVMWAHYMMYVGLIPLAETVHELVHSGFLFIPTTHVYGKYKDFIELYKPYIEPNLLKKIESSEEYSQAYDIAKETKVLTMNMVHIDPSGAYELPQMSEVHEMMQEVLKQDENRLKTVIYS